MDLRSWCLPRVKGNTKGRVKSPIKSGSSVAKTENGTITSRCCRSYSRSLNHSHLWRARMMVASVSEWHLWIRFCPRQETNLLQVAVTLFSDCVVKDRSSWSSFLRLFSCAELESHDEAGSLLLDAGPPTWEIKMILKSFANQMRKWSKHYKWKYLDENKIRKYLTCTHAWMSVDYFVSVLCVHVLLLSCWLTYEFTYQFVWNFLECLDGFGYKTGK